MSALFDHHPHHPLARRACSSIRRSTRRAARRARLRATALSCTRWPVHRGAPPLRELATPTHLQAFSVAYDAQERLLLDPYLATRPSDADGVLRAWASQFIRGSGVAEARLLPAAMARFIHQTMRVRGAARCRRADPVRHVADAKRDRA